VRLAVQSHIAIHTPSRSPTTISTFPRNRPKICRKTAAQEDYGERTYAFYRISAFLASRMRIIVGTLFNPVHCVTDCKHPKSDAKRKTELDPSPYKPRRLRFRSKISRDWRNARQRCPHRPPSVRCNYPAGWSAEADSSEHARSLALADNWGTDLPSHSRSHDSSITRAHSRALWS
jgi:hypothetical protein